MSPTKKRILIADDHEIVRHGVRNLIASVPEYECCAEATTGRDAVRLSQELQPDVAVLDISMPELNGIEAAQYQVALKQVEALTAVGQGQGKQLVIVPASALDAFANAFGMLKGR